ncbi:transglycosylase SLT domain-containing protein [Octadecabacter sp. 1_MG-2023]|uniref:lytic transglycosylase domain-containing protein n=1 Tax=unclassified Octadecabacter TaxID=196158 RepID=UPI001C09F0FD|nr:MULTISPECIES: lytic transglycosylase domain-containing protein [unclassified Octadecabacter]MBU2992006.1 lytic transglycosylase domain-containing protein [Octadecabacter sp. B2R22]MDO6735981.1 transglycosylase SLT domain-containing protein [Octadecabacter sp. 1_MG-2023]
MRRSKKIVTLFAQCWALALAIGSASISAAENHLFQSDFTFRRVGVPQAGATNRITVQVAPAAPSGPSAPSAAGSAGSTPRAPSAPAIAGLAPAPNGVEWYWEAISPSLDDAHSFSLEKAVAALRSAPEGQAVPAPRLQGMTELADRFGVEILTASIGTNVSPALVLAVISVESAGRADAVSSAGAQGLMQLMPPTADRFGVTDALNAQDNIKGGTAYLDWLLNEFDNGVIFALAGYNAGEGAVRNNNGIPPYAETRAYVPKVLAAWEVARGLCITPPELVTDGCVFAVNGG